VRHQFSQIVNLAVPEKEKGSNFQIFTHIGKQLKHHKNLIHKLELMKTIVFSLLASIQ